MSNIILQFGQCGNQIGQTLFDCIYEDVKCKNQATKSLNNEYKHESMNQWFHVKQTELEARSILIDTEEKVTSLANNKKPYKFKNIISSSYGGSANNWAFGYSSRSSLVSNAVMERLRHEIEKCDFISCLLNILSSSGGTGSGVGSRIIELIRDEYPSKFITNIVVLPFQKGDVVIQNYNTLLTLTKLYDITDNTILFENDKTHDVCKKTMTNKEIKFSDLNGIIARQLASIMQPVKNSSFCKLISSLSCHTSYKFIQIKTSPHISQDHIKFESVPNWMILANHIFKSSKSDILINSKLCKRLRYIGNVLISRGNTTPQDIDIKRFQDASLYVPWMPDSEKISHFNQQRQLLTYQKHISLISNSNNICSSVDHVLEDAWNLFTHGAYLHHYKKYGVDDEYFLESFQKLEHILMSSTWSQQEKQQLLEALKKYGVNDIGKISSHLPYKSVCEIRTVISKYENLAIQSLTDGSSSSSSTSDASIDKWICIMKQMLTRNNHNIVARTLKYIALFERRTTSNINLDDCYMALYNFANGQPNKQLDYETEAFFYDCLTKLAKSVKDNNNRRDELYLDSLELNKLSTAKTYGGPKKGDKNVLLSDTNMNPCKVPANLLTENRS